MGCKSDACKMAGGKGERRWSLDCGKAQAIEEDAVDF